MEGLYSRKNPSKDLFSDTSHRMPQRPYSVKSGEGVSFQELGSSFGRSKSISTVRKTYKNSKPPRNLRKEPPPVEGESDDEILLSSSQPSESAKDATSSPKRVSKTKRHDSASGGVETVLVNGHLLDAHPDYRPSSFDALKNLRFSKKVPAGNATEDVPPPSSSLDLSQELSKPISDEIEIVDIPSKPARKTSTRRRSPSTTRSGTRPVSGAKYPPTPTKNASRPSAKPHQKMCILLTRKPDNNPYSTPRPAAQNRAFPLCSNTPEKPTIPESERTIKKPPLSSTSRQEPQEFPMSLLAKENYSDSACTGEGSSTKTKKIGVPRSATFVHTPRPIPLPSPLRAKPVFRSTTFPNLSPLTSSMEKGKGKAPVRKPDDLDTLTDGGRKQSGPRPFPMILSGIGSRSTSPSSRSSRSTKRASSDGSEAGQGRTTKKHKDSHSEIPELYDYLSEPMEDDSLDMGSPRDPSKVCPYCDEDLPAYPTPFFRHILATARKKSVSDPRPRNRGGLKAPLTIYASVCQRHRFESHQLPIAIKKGWPNTLDFAGVPARVKKMRKELDAILLGDASDVEDHDIDEHKGPRGKSVFWGEVKKEMKKQGSRTAMGVKGQFASFEKTQPGYYGEQGSVIIHQTLFDLFPPSSFDASLIAPLAPAEFIQRVLVPEAAVRLIAEDLSLNMKDALVTLRDSAQYGVAMFPDTGETKLKRGGGGGGDDDDDDDEMGVADRIVMERARARRKELAEEEKVENAMLEEERAAQRARAWEIRREKAVERARQLKVRAGEVDTDEFSEVSETGDVRRRGTRQQLTTTDSESDAMSMDSSAGRRATRAAKGAQKKSLKVGRRAAQTEASDSGSIESVDDLPRRTNIKGHKAKGRCAKPDALDKKTRSATSSERKKPVSGFASLDDGQDKTPRAGRQRKTDTNATEGPVKLPARACPLELARNRIEKSARAGRDPWTGSLLTSTPDNADSDASNTSGRSQRLFRPSIKKGDSFSWLLRGSQSSNDSS